MSTNGSNGAEVTPRKLWFGFLTSAVAWSTLGCLDILVTWRACQHQESFGLPAPHPGVRLLYGLLAVALFVVSIWSGITSYRNWRRLSAQKDFIEAQGVERREFMAVLGVIITVTLGMGIIWLALPPIFLDICWRAR